MTPRTPLESRARDHKIKDFTLGTFSLSPALETPPKVLAMMLNWDKVNLTE